MSVVPNARASLKTVATDPWPVLLPSRWNALKWVLNTNLVVALPIWLLLAVIYGLQASCAGTLILGLGVFSHQVFQRSAAAVGTAVG